MLNLAAAQAEISSRQLLRVLRRQPDLFRDDEELPESVLWRAYCELRNRGESDAGQHFMRSIRTLHRRRALACTDLPTEDGHTDEHRLVDDPMLAELWKAYKRCICSQRTGPAAQLLNDIENQIIGQ